MVYLNVNVHVMFSEFDEKLNGHLGGRFNLYYVLLVPQSKAAVKLEKAYVGKHRSVYLPVKHRGENLLSLQIYITIIASAKTRDNNF